MKTMVIRLTDEQYAYLKHVMDRACDERPDNLHLQDLWHACAKAEAVSDPAPVQCVWCNASPCVHAEVAATPA